MVSNCGTYLKLSSQDQRRGHLHSYNVYLLLVYLTIVISPGPFDKEDEEEGIKEERGDADRYVSVVFAGLPTHTVTPVRGIICRCLTCGSYVRPLRGLHSHSMLCLAPINTTPGLLSLYSVAQEVSILRQSRLPARLSSLQPTMGDPREEEDAGKKRLRKESLNTIQ